MEHTRRNYLRASGAIAAVGLAGCLGNQGGSACDSADLLPVPTMGRTDAPVTVTVFEDFACPHCQIFSLEVLPKIVSEYVTEGIVRYEHRDFPIPVDDRWSWQVASAAREVQDTVDDGAFFEFAHRIFEHLGDYSLDDIETVASNVGADPGTVSTAAADEEYRSGLEADRRCGVEMDVQGTPTVFVNGTALSHYNWETVSAGIESARP